MWGISKKCCTFAVEKVQLLILKLRNYKFSNQEKKELTQVQAKTNVYLHWQYRR